MDLIMDAILDTLKIWPFLWGIYIMFEYIGNKRTISLNNSTLTPILGALSGCIPQCGASVAAASLYASRMITVGTLLAVFLSTSDEAIPLMMAHPNQWKTIGRLILIKVIFASFIGILIDALMHRGNKIVEVRGTQKHYCQDPCCRKQSNIFQVSFERSLKVIIFLLIMTILINWIVDLIGEASLSQLLLSNSWGQPLIAALIGLIPNCISSVLLTDLYLQGIISFGSVLAGLCTGAGAGLLALFKVNKSMRQNLVIMIALYILGATLGLIFHSIIYIV